MPPKTSKIFNELFSRTLEKAETHTLTRNDFFYLTENKKKQLLEKRVTSRKACDLLLSKTIFKQFKLCLDVNVGYLVYPGKIYGSFSTTEIRMLILRILEKVGDERLLKPHFINEILKQLKTSKIAIHGPTLLIDVSTG